MLGYNSVTNYVGSLKRYNQKTLEEVTGTNMKNTFITIVYTKKTI